MFIEAPEKKNHYRHLGKSFISSSKTMPVATCEQDLASLLLQYIVG